MFVSCNFFLKYNHNKNFQATKQIFIHKTTQHCFSKSTQEKRQFHTYYIVLHKYDWNQTRTITKCTFTSLTHIIKILSFRMNIMARKHSLTTLSYQNWKKKYIYKPCILQRVRQEKIVSFLALVAWLLAIKIIYLKYTNLQ